MKRGSRELSRVWCPGLISLSGVIVFVSPCFPAILVPAALSESSNVCSGSLSISFEFPSSILIKEVLGLYEGILDRKPLESKEVCLIDSFLLIELFLDRE